MNKLMLKKALQVVVLLTIKPFSYKLTGYFFQNQASDIFFAACEAVLFKLIRTKTEISFTN